jgi:hypothetical protein
MFTAYFVNMQQIMNSSVYTKVVLTEINTTGEPTQHDATIQYLRDYSVSTGMGFGKIFSPE